MHLINFIFYKKMETILLGKLKSTFILQKILGFIKDKKVILKLFVHSKSLQNKLGIKLMDYQKVFFKNFYFENYLCFNISCGNNDDINFDKDKLKNTLKDDLLKIKFDYKNIINNKEYLIYYFQKYYKELNEEGIDKMKENKILIDIYSPFFETLSETEFFSKLFNINILPKIIIKKYNLTNDYINYFEKLIKIKSKFSSISIYNGGKDDFNDLNEYRINSNNLNNLIIFILNLNNNFSFYFNCKDEILKNMRSLRVDAKFIKHKEILTDSFENINNLKSLEELQLNDLIFKNTLTIKLYDLKKLYICNCKNISFDENKPYNIEILELNNSEIIEPKVLFNFPKLKKYFINNIFGKYNWNISIFDIIKNTKYLKINSDKIPKIENNLSIEFLTVEYVSFKKEINKENLEKIISMNKFKFFDMLLYNIDNDDFIKLQGDNTSIEKAKIQWADNADCILYNLQNKFPKLTNLTISITDIHQGFNQNSISSLEIKENPKCKINQFSIDSFLCSNIKFYIQSYENLFSVSFNFNTRFDISNNNFPIFNNNCKIIFKSLKHFSFIAPDCYRMNFEILNNIYNNIDNMPNLKSFVLKCYQENINKDFLIKFIKKILSMKLNHVELYLTKKRNDLEKFHEEYSLNELKEIYPTIDFNFLNHINIRKFHQSKDLVLKFFHLDL